MALYPASLLCEELQIDGVGHEFVAGVVGMQMIAAVGVGREVHWILRIARGGVQIDDRVEPASAADPLIDGRVRSVSEVA